MVRLCVSSWPLRNGVPRTVFKLFVCVCVSLFCLAASFADPTAVAFTSITPPSIPMGGKAVIALAGCATVDRALFSVRLHSGADAAVTKVSHSRHEHAVVVGCAPCPEQL